MQNNSKNLLFLFKNKEKLANISDTSRDHEFKVSNLNDFTSECIRKEKSDFEEIESLAVSGVCPSRHGGLLDYPKLVTESSGLVTSKWEVCINILFPHLDDNFVPPQVVANGVQNDDEDNTTTEEEFSASVAESANKLILHHAWLTEVLVKNGDVEKLVGVAGGLCLMRNKLWQYNEMLQGRPFQSLYKEMCDLVESLCEQMTVYYTDTISTIVLQDSESQDWEDEREWEEGERVSYCMQMWWYSMETTRHFLWSSLSPGMSHNIFLNILNQSLSLITVRYTHIRPSPARLGQYRADILSVLLSVSQLLTSLTPDLESLTRVTRDQSKLSSVHSKCQLLLSLLTLVTAPSSVLSQCLRSCESSVDTDHSWCQVLLPSLYSPHNTVSSQLYLVSRLVSDQPQPHWSLMSQLCVSADHLFTRTLLTQMGAFVPSVDTVSCPSTCAALHCGHVCLGPAGTNWPVLVVHGALLLVTGHSTHSTALVQCLEPLLTKLSPASWECLHYSSVWSVRQPVWVSALLRLMLPYLTPAVQDLLQGVDEGRTWTMSHVTSAKQTLVNNMLSLVETLPDSVSSALVFIRQLIPDSVSPLASSPVCQLLVTTVYQALISLVPVLKQFRIQKEKIDFIIAVSESLCSTTDNIDLTVLDKAVDSGLDIRSLADIESVSRNMQTNNTEPQSEIMEKYEVAAFNVLNSTDENKISLMALYR